MTISGLLNFRFQWHSDLEKRMRAVEKKLNTIAVLMMMQLLASMAICSQLLPDIQKGIKEQGQERIAEETRV
jgi:hypothetical protein